MNVPSSPNPTFAFFGTPDIAVSVLEALRARGLVPSLVVTAPDKPKGRHLALTPPPAKVWADAHGVPVIQPQSLKDGSVAAELRARAPEGGWDVFVVAAYGKLIPKEILDMPKAGTLNVHPSLLPKLRGPSPIQSAILSEDMTGVTIIQLDEEMDHGLIVAQKELDIAPWPPKAEALEAALGREGGELLAEVLAPWVEGTIEAKPQDHSKATYCKKIEKAAGLIDRAGNPQANFRKIQAFSGWPGTYFFLEKNGKPLRVIIKDAKLENGELRITRVIPEGKKEMDYGDFLRSYEERSSA